jgi:hypothetical protein
VLLQLLGLDVSKSEIGAMLAEVDEDGSGKAAATLGHYQLLPAS